MMMCFALPAMAQTGKITANVIDAETNEGIIGAVMEVVNTDTGRRHHSVSGAKGAVNLTGVAFGEYDVTVAFIGYTTMKKRISHTSSNTNLGNIALQEGVAIETVVKEVQALRTSQNGDTVAYNAAAFKVASDADVEGLLKKMPGITISNGQVEAQGEQVKKIFVDGKEFFGEDVSTALNSLPAQSVDRIEVFNKLSDNAEFSGMDDGEGYKAINIVTHENMRKGVFGKLYGGYGYQPDINGSPKELNFENQTEYKPEVTDVTSHHKYNLGGNVNLFNGNSRLSVIGLFNNVNQQNFSFEDILGVTGGGGGHGPGGGRGVGRYMVRPQSGVAQVASIGMQYSNSWGKDDKVKLNGSYFYNQTNTSNKSIVERWYDTPSPDDELIQQGESETFNYNHRLNMRLDYKINSNMSLMSRTNLSFQGNNPYSQQYGELKGESADDMGLNYKELYNRSEGESNAYRFSEFLQYRVKLGKPGRTITLDGRYATRQTPNSWSNNASIDYDMSQKPATAQDRYIKYITEQGEDDVRVNFTYTEPLSKTSQLSFQYRMDYEDQQMDRLGYITGADYMAGREDKALSMYNTSTSVEHRVGPGYRYAKGRNTFVANIFYQHSELNGNLLDRPHVNDKPTYFIMGNVAFNPQNTIRVFISSYTQNPEITTLQEVYDLTDVQNISKGNKNLKSSYTHRINFHYVRSNIEKGRTFMWMFSTQYTQDYIGQSIYYNPKDMIEVDGVTYNPWQYRTYDNMDGYANLRTHVSYGFPIAPIKCNLNVMVGTNWSKTPSKIDNKLNYTSNMGYDATVSLGSNISENVDFTLQWNGTYNDATQSRGKSNQYFSHTASGSLKWVFWKGFNITAAANYNQYVGMTDNYNEDYLICNFYVGKKLFKSQLAEVLVGVNDMFNQNNAFVRTVGSGYTQNAWNSVVGRYFTVQFNYNLRYFGKNATKDMSKYEGMDVKSGAPAFGRPPHPMMHR
jgi:hypothetical protein